MTVIFNFNDYLKNPIAEFCVQQLDNPTILTFDDVMPDIQKLNYAKKSYDRAMSGITLPSFIGDQLRLYYSLQYDNYFYCDADVFLTKEIQDKIWKNKNCIYCSPSLHEINNGTFFCSDKDCEFNHYYFDLYEKNDFGNMTNCNVYFKYPYKVDYKNMKAGDMNLLDVPVKHFILSKMFSFKKEYENSNKEQTVYFTRKPCRNFDKIDHPLIWQFDCGDELHILSKKCCGTKAYQWFLNCESLSKEFQFDLWKEQVKYSLQNPNLKFEEV